LEFEIKRQILPCPRRIFGGEKEKTITVLKTFGSGLSGQVIYIGAGQFINGLLPVKNYPYPPNNSSSTCFALSLLASVVLL
jgi:hypothetical protein